MSEIVTYAKAEFFRTPNLSESRMYTELRSSEVWIEVD